MNKNKQSILIVDDTVADIKILSELLQPEYSTMFARDGATCLQMARSKRPDLILLDILMPEMDGYEVYRNLKEDRSTSDIPVIFVTALTGDENEIEGLELGAVDYITKPFNPTIVRARVRNHLALHEGIKLRRDVERMIQHDLRSPIATMINVLDMVFETEELSQNLREILLDVRSYVYRVFKILNKSFDMYAMETGAYQLRPVTVNLMQILENIIKELKFQDTEAVFELNLDGSRTSGDEVFTVEGEELLCYSLFSNLLLNALQASPKGKPIRVFMGTLDDGRRSIRVHNMGMVPEAVRDKFFEKYATAGKDKGTGLGTYIAMLIARTLGGEIEMSTSETEGTTITVIIPSAA